MWKQRQITKIQYHCYLHLTQKSNYCQCKWSLTCVSSLAGILISTQRYSLYSMYFDLKLFYYIFDLTKDSFSRAWTNSFILKTPYSQSSYFDKYITLTKNVANVNAALLELQVLCEFRWARCVSMRRSRFQTRVSGTLSTSSIAEKQGILIEGEGSVQLTYFVLIRSAALHNKVTLFW